MCSTIIVDGVAMKDKRCPKCCILKPLSEFHKDKARYDGVTVYCKRCEGERNRERYHENMEKERLRNKKWRENNKEKNRKRCREWAKKNPEKVKESQHRYYISHKKEIIKRNVKRKLKRKLNLIKILGGKCQRCGYDKCLCVLDFHHIEGRKEYWSDWMKKDYDKSKLVLLCANCHRETHYKCMGVK